MTDLPCVRIPLRKKDGSIAAYAIVDDADAAKIGASRWYLGSRGYAMRQYRNPTDPPGRKRNRCEFMHRAVLGLSRGDGLEADHINHDKLDNRRSNLRSLTRAENEQNKGGVRAASGLRNVFFARERGFFARVIVGGKQHVRGYFPTPEEAAVHADAMRRDLHRFCA